MLSMDGCRAGFSFIQQHTDAHFTPLQRRTITQLPCRPGDAHRQAQARRCPARTGIHPYDVRWTDTEEGADLKPPPHLAVASAFVKWRLSQLRVS